MNNEQLSDILSDKSKTAAVLDTLNAARQLAAAGAFGKERSEKLFVELLKFSSNLQVAAKDVVATNKAAGTKANSTTTALAAGKGDLLELYSTNFMDAKKRYDKFSSEFDVLHAQFMKLYDRQYDRNNPLSREEEETMNQINLKMTGLAMERNRALSDMKDFSSFGLFGEGSLGFKGDVISSMIDDEQLANLIQVALKNELFKMVNQDINETSQMTTGNPHLDIKTGVSATNQIVNGGDTLIMDSDHNPDKHLNDNKGAQ